MRTLREQLRRPDWLAELQALVVFALVAVAVPIVANLVSLATRQPVVVSLPASAVTGLAGTSAGLAPGAAIASDNDVDVSLADPTAADTAWYALRVMPELLLVAAVLALLWRLLAAARRDDPFTAATVRRLRVLGGLSAAGGLLAGVLGTIAEMALSDAATGGRFAQATVTVSPVWLLVGGGFVAFAELVNRARSMRAELDRVI
jgi:hypothetical protein